LKKMLQNPIQIKVPPQTWKWRDQAINPTTIRYDVTWRAQIHDTVSILTKNVWP
jgi:hypothetical protein